MHDLTLVTTIAAAFTAAWVVGLASQRLGLSPIVGYIVAGALIGPHTPGFVGDVHLATQLAEIGVILLMFGVGLHFHLKDLIAVRGIAIPGAVGQSVVTTLLAIVIFGALGMPANTGSVLGMAMSVASTVVLMRVLMDADMLNSPSGHAAVGWLIVEDIFTVILLVMIPVIGHDTAGGGTSDGSGGLWASLGMALLKLAALVAIVLVAGSKFVPRLLMHVARLRSRELFTLTVLVLSIAVAAASYLFFGASMALGAFLAGMVVAQSPVSHQAAAEALPMRDAFSVLFFVSVGMLFDPAFLIEQPLLIAAALGLILLVKPVAALIIVAILGHSARTALTVALGLAQIGEFSFILSELARRYGLMPDEGHNVLVAASIISISLNPLLFRSLPRIESWLKRHPLAWKLVNGRAETRAAAANAAIGSEIANRAAAGRLAIVVGYGQVGRSVDRLLRDAGMDTVVIDLSMDTVSSLNDSGQAAVFGDAAHEDILLQAGVTRASHVVLTLSRSPERVHIVANTRRLNPRTRILVRAPYVHEREELERAGATAAVFDEAEASVALARVVLADTGVHREAAERKIRDLRLQLIAESMADFRTQRVRSVMVPWSRVRRLAADATRDQVLEQVAEERFSRWPVVDASGRATGYLLTKDLISRATKAEWKSLVRSLGIVAPDDTVEDTLSRMQEENATVYVVEDEHAPVGWVTLEDILEQVVGRIEDEYPHEARVSIGDSLARGAIVLDVMATSRDAVIVELARAIPRQQLPDGVDGNAVAALAIEREESMSTNLGNGVAIPHARCPELARPIAVFGRSRGGVMFTPDVPERVHMVVLLVTPLEDPELQITLLGQVAEALEDEAARSRLLEAGSPADVLDHFTRRSRR